VQKIHVLLKAGIGDLLAKNIPTRF